MPRARSGTYWLFDSGVGIAQEGSRAGVVLVVEVGDLGATVARFEALGGARLSDEMEVVMDDEALRMALVADPEGNRVGLFERG